MKKKITMAILLVMILELVACGSEQNKQSVVTESAEPSEVFQPTESNAVSNNGEIAENNDFEYTFKDPSSEVNVAFDYPYMRVIEEATSRIFKSNYYIIAYCRDIKSADLKDIPDELMEIFSFDTDTHLAGEPESIVAKESEELVINGVPVLKITGYVRSAYDETEKIELPMRGYVFEKDGAIVELIAVIRDEISGEGLGEMNEVIDAMIKTLRDE